MLAPPMSRSVGLDKNPALAAHLQTLRDRGDASEQDIKDIQGLAGHLSAQEGRAIRDALTDVRVSPEARLHLDSYMLDEFETRIQHVERSKKVGDVVNAVALGATLVGVPVLNHFLSIGGLDAGVNLAANGVQLALMAGEYLGGAAAAKAIANYVSGHGGAGYGDHD